MLTSLKAEAKGSSAVSHEAKLGMMVITILFFAFCFLVYHKMDLHQRQLTQASIQPTAETPSADQPLDTAAQLASQGTKSAATDPLMNLADMSGEEAFGSSVNSADVVTSTTPTRTSQAPLEFDAVDPASEGRPETSESSLESLTSTESPASAEALDDSVPAFGFGEPMADDASSGLGDVPTSGSSASSEFTPADDNALTEPAELPESMAALETPEVLPPADELATNESSSASSELAISDASMIEEKDAASGPPLEQAETPELAFGEFSAPETSTSVDAQEPELALPEPASATEPEPVLLAMAEPGTQEGFSGGFAADVVESSEPTIGRAPSEDSVGAFSNTPPSRGYNAVTQPGRQPSGNSIRTAAGSGADGKFSLSAFNYQNTGTEPAPDDGSTFESVVVQEGDNYSRISKRVYGTTRYFSALAVFNQHRIREPKHMRPGMIVLTPAKEILEEKYPQLFVDSKPKVVQPAEFMILDDGSPAYRVGERETLSEISGRFLGRSSRWIEIYRLNQTVVKDPNKLKAGLILALPADAAEVRVAP